MRTNEARGHELRIPNVRHLYVLIACSDADPCTNYSEADLLPCGQPCSLIDVDDILSILGAFVGIFDCP